LKISPIKWDSLLTSTGVLHGGKKTLIVSGLGFQFGSKRLSGFQIGLIICKIIGDSSSSNSCGVSVAQPLSEIRKVKIALIISVGQRGPEGMESIGTARIVSKCSYDTSHIEACHIEAAICASCIEYQSSFNFSNFASNRANSWRSHSLFPNTLFRSRFRYHGVYNRHFGLFTSSSIISVITLINFIVFIIIVGGKNFIFLRRKLFKGFRL